MNVTYYDNEEGTALREGEAIPEEYQAQAEENRYAQS